jgi:nicotinamide riboside kinase
MKSPLVINIFGGPGIGKSTISAGIFYTLKRMSINTELVTEFAKDLVWEKHKFMLEDQLLVFANQHRRISRLKDQVDVIVTDSPFIMGLVYANEGSYKSMPQLMFEAWNTFNNLNIVVTRSTNYQEVGRLQDEQTAIDIDLQIMKLLDDNQIKYRTINPLAFHDASVHIVDTLIKPLLEK